MVLHTNPQERKYLIKDIQTKFPNYHEKLFNGIEIDRVQYLAQLVFDQDINTQSEIKRILKIK